MLARGARWLRALWGRPPSGPPPAGPPGPPTPPEGPMGLEGGGGALRHRGAGELLRGLLVLRLCACPPLVRHADTVLRASRRALPRPLWAALLRASFYGHFALGAGPAQVERAVRRMRELRLRPLLALPIEAAAPEEAELERNLEAALRCADMAAATAEPAAGAAMMQLKVTALMSARLCETLSRRLAEPGAGLSPERLADVMGGEAPSFPCLTRAENAELGGALRRLDAVAQRAGRCHVRLLLDAEQQPLNAALALAGAALAERHNRELPLVWGTCQAYAQGAARRLAGAAAGAAARGLCFGVKLVRGAYLEEERERERRECRERREYRERRAEPEPEPPARPEEREYREFWEDGAVPRLQPSREDTDRSYARCLELGLALAARGGGRVELMVATHNEGSVRLALRRMAELGLPRSGPVSFGQLLGMSDSLSLALGAAGYSAYKSAPLGDPEAVLPYLARRAREHGALLGGTGAERLRLRREIRDRLRRRLRML